MTVDERVRQKMAEIAARPEGTPTFPNRGEGRAEAREGESQYAQALREKDKLLKGFSHNVRAADGTLDREFMEEVRRTAAAFSLLEEDREDEEMARECRRLVQRLSLANRTFEEMAKAGLKVPKDKGSPEGGKG